MGYLELVRRALSAIAVVSLLAAAGAVVYRFQVGEGEYGLVPIAVPLAIATVALSVNLVLSILATVKGATSRQYLPKFRRATLLFGLFWAVLLVVAVAEPDISVLADAVVTFGGAQVVGIYAAAFLAAWVGLRERATEALAVAVVAWGAVGAVGVQQFADDGSGAGLIIAGVLGVYFGIRSYTGTDWWLASGRSGGDAPESRGTRSREQSTKQPTQQQSGNRQPTRVGSDGQRKRHTFTKTADAQQSSQSGGSTDSAKSGSTRTDGDAGTTTDRSGSEKR